MAGVGTVTLLFTDLVGSTALASEIGDREIEAIRRSHFATLRAAVAATGGNEVKNLGDGLMVVYRGASDAIEGAVAMQRAVDRANAGARVPLSMKIGISVGDVTEEDDDWFGTPVNEAARLCAAAIGGQILVSDLVRMLAGSRNRHELTPAGSFQLKGLPEPLTVCEVQWTPAARTAEVAFPAALLRREGGIVGRDDELARLGEVWSAAQQGRPATVLIAGEAGIGKTHLATAVASRAHADGATVLLGRCDEALAVPFLPWIEALRQLTVAVGGEAVRDWAGVRTRELVRLVPELIEQLPDLDPPSTGDPETERFTLFEAVAALLVGATAAMPMLLVFDDLHWSDTTSLLLLRHLMRSASGTRLVVIGTYRAGEVEDASTLAKVLGDLKRDGIVERVSLRGLDGSGTDALLRSWAGHSVPNAFARAVFAETNGNPFFVNEVLGHLTDRGVVQRRGDTWDVPAALEELGVPEGVRELVRGRAQHLTEGAQGLLAVAALTGREFDLDVVVAVAATKEDEALDGLDEAVAIGMIEEVPGVAGRYRFGHALIRTALEESIGTTRRARLHLRIGETLEVQHPSDLTALAHHYAEATAAGATKALEYSLLAARAALAALAHEEAIEHANRGLRALELVDDPGPSARVDLLLTLAEAQNDAGDLVAARAAAVAATDEARTLDDTERFVAAVFLYGIAGELFLDPVRSRLVDEAMQRLPEGDSTERARLISARAEWNTVASEAVDLEAARSALEMARRIGDSRTIAYCAGIVGDLLVGSPHPNERVELAMEALMRSEPFGIGRGVFNSIQWSPPALLELGDRPGCEAFVADLEMRARALQLDHVLFVLAGCRGLLAQVDGRFDDMERIGADAEAKAKSDDQYTIIGRLAQRVSIARDTGGLEQFLPQLEALSTMPAFVALRVDLAYACLALDRREEARAILEEFKAQDFAAVPQNWARPSTLDGLADLATEFNDADAATSILTMLDEFRGLLLIAYGVVGSRGAADRARGQLFSVLGRHNEALDAFAAAESLETSVGGRSLLPRTWFAHARARIARDTPGDRDLARELCQKASTEATALGMTPLCAQIEALRA